MRYELNRAHLDSAFAKQWYLFGWLSIACFTGFAACMYALFQRFYSFGLLESHLWALLSLAFLPIFFGPISQLYDPTTLLLFPLAYLCMLEGRLSVYYLVLVLALVNKEISFLLIALFAVVHWHRMRRLTLFGHLAVQCASYVVIRMAIHFYTVHNPGADVENWVSYNLTFIVTPSVLLMLFMLKVVVDYPKIEEEKLIVRQNVAKQFPKASTILKPQNIIDARNVVKDVYLDEKIEKYILDIVFATRFPENYGLEKFSVMINYGGSPRASINLAMASKAYAFIKRRGYVIPEDVRAVCHDVLRHRIGLTYEAEAENIKSEDIITEILNTIEVP